MSCFVKADESFLYRLKGVIQKDQSRSCMKYTKNLRQRGLDSTSCARTHFSEETSVQNVVLNFRHPSDGHDPFDRCRKNAERARFSQRALGFSANLGALTLSESAIVGFSQRPLRLER